MLGYVRCQPSEMLGKHHALYRAAYCGLCHSMKKNIGVSVLPFLSYDFVFLALMRMIISKEEIRTEKQFCLLHPFRDKKMRLADHEALSYAAIAGLFLLTEKLEDDRIDGDQSLFRRVQCCLYLPILRSRCRRILKNHGEYRPLYDQIAAAMSDSRTAEKRGANFDTLSNDFGETLSAIFSFGLKGDNRRLFSSIGFHLGRIIYAADATDDWEKDEKNGAFNPLLNRYGPRRNAEDHLAEIDRSIAFSIGEMKLALDLLEGDANMIAVCDNVICHGIPATVNTIMKPKYGDKK